MINPGYADVDVNMSFLNKISSVINATLSCISTLVIEKNLYKSRLNWRHFYCAFLTIAFFRNLMKKQYKQPRPHIPANKMSIQGIIPNPFSNKKPFVSKSKKKYG